jgi:hypothetical protein
MGRISCRLVLRWVRESDLGPAPHETPELGEYRPVSPRRFYCRLGLGSDAIEDGGGTGGRRCRIGNDVDGFGRADRTDAERT